MINKPKVDSMGGNILRKFTRGMRVLPIVFGLLFFTAAGSAYYFYAQNQELKQNPQKAAQAENQALVERVGRHIVLPMDENATIATVTDSERLKDQAFFTNAVKGDKVLIYTNAKKAILYRPSSDQIVEVAPVNIGTGQPTGDETPTDEE